VEKAALAQLLATPLDPGLLHGPFQAGTVRMPTELWKRVGWIASFTGRTKQEIIGEALLAYLERLKDETR
jgi:predicted DNA-binding protein